MPVQVHQVHLDGFWSAGRVKGWNTQMFYVSVWEHAQEPPTAIAAISLPTPKDQWLVGIWKQDGTLPVLQEKQETYMFLLAPWFWDGIYLYIYVHISRWDGICMKTSKANKASIMYKSEGARCAFLIFDPSFWARSLNATEWWDEG